MPGSDCGVGVGGRGQPRSRDLCVHPPVEKGYLCVCTENGVEESMSFSRILRAVLNERMYNARDRLDKDSIIKADDTKDGSFAPFIEPTI